MSSFAHSQSEFCRIEYIGGPFDGHVEVFAVPDAQLPQDLIFFVSSDGSKILDGRRVRRRHSVTSIALYERQRRCGSWNYGFVGAISPKSLGI